MNKNLGGGRCAAGRLLGPAVRGFTCAALLWHAGLGLAQTSGSCTAVLARVVSVQGQVELRRGDTTWPAIQLDATLCAGDTVRVQAHSRAALRLNNETTLRLDQGTVLTLAPSDRIGPTLMEQLKGRLHVITRTPRPFHVRTPFVNANVQGTEFTVRVDETSTTVTVIEGVVVAANSSGSVELKDGQAATARQGGGAPDIVVRSADAVNWTLHVPAVLDFGALRADATLAPSAALARSGRIDQALAALGPPPDGPAGAGFRVYRAALLLQVGRFDEAKPDIDAALQIDPRRADALALRAIVALVANDKGNALALARQAVALDAQSAGARVALSYAQQAHFDIAAALASAIEATRVDPAHALAHARVAELELSSGRLDAALAAAQRAVQIEPELGRTQTMLGFAALVRIDLPAAKAAFERAIRQGQDDPLPRLGMGLAKIREGDLAGGREEIEIAAILDPGNSLIRSYLGKAYFEEQRGALAARQFALAKEQDPRDPTPHFYDAVRALAGNLPVDAMRDLGRSMALNDNRAVYRSRLLLDQDQAARTVSLARTYRALGFDQLALLEAVKSLSLDPGDSSAHRFLADSYNGQIRSEAARVSEQLQAQLRQPLALNTLQPQALADRQLVVEGAGPVQASGQEFTSLFNRNRVALKVDAVAGDHGTLGDQLFVTGLNGSLAYSLGQYHQESKGLRPNNDSRRDLYSAFVHLALTPSVRVQAELRDDRLEQGDLSLRFDEDNFSPTRRGEFKQQSVRLGGLFQFDPASSLVVSAISGRSKEQLYSKLAPLDRFEDRERFGVLELQHLIKLPALHLSTGFSFQRSRTVLEFAGDATPLNTIQRNLYASATLTGLPWGLRPQVGLSHDTFDEADVHLARTNPLLGLLWELSPDTTLRAASVQTIKRTLVSSQTLQPSQVQGFSAYFDDPAGTVSKRSGVALHHRLSERTFIGAEWSGRNLQVPGFPGDPHYDWTERLARVYVYRVLSSRATLTAELQSERLRRPQDNTGNEGFTDLRTLIAPVALRANGPGGWSLTAQATFIDQRARHENASFDLVDGSDRFVVADLSLSYQLPGRSGTLSLDAKNLFDRRFRYQEIDVFSSARVSPRRFAMLRLSTSF